MAGVGTRPPHAVTVRAPAKINLHLGVGPAREDGYHELISVFQAVNLFDLVTVEPARRLSVRVAGEDSAKVPTTQDNLAARAAAALADHVGRRPSVRITLTKAIPVAGGMAGGSADAAAALVACDLLWRAGLPRDELASVGAAVGSDVPFAMMGGTALGTGRGDLLTPVLAKGRYHWVLAVAEQGLSTPAVFAELDRHRGVYPGCGPTEADPVLAALRTGDATELAAVLRNDLEPAALRLRPRLVELLDAGRDRGALAAIVSGSGPTCAFLVATPAEGVALAAALAGDGLCRSLRQAFGPVPGARVPADRGE